jgi:lysophospholipase L1-like esterase
MAQMLHEIGRPFNDLGAWGGVAWKAIPSRDARRGRRQQGQGDLLFFGPYATDLGVGKHRAFFWMRQGGARPDDPVAVLEVVNPQGINEPVRLELLGRDFADAGEDWAEFALDYDHRGRGGVVFQARWPGAVEVVAGGVADDYMEQARPVPQIPSGEFHLRAGDRVVFFGDSITEAGLYARYIELFQRAAHSGERVEFFNAGVAGDTTQDGLARINADVLSLRPTVVVVNFGVNDSVAGLQNLDARLGAYRDQNAQIVDRLQFHGVRVYFMAPFTMDDSVDPNPARADANACLGLFSRIQEELAREKNLPALPAPWGAVCEAIRAQELPSNPRFHLAEDSVHPGPRGHLAAAAVLLSMWGARPLVHRLEIDAPALQPGESLSRRFEGVPIPWTPPGMEEDWFGADWLRLELLVQGQGGPWRARVGDGWPFLVEAGRPRNLAALRGVLSRVEAARAFDEAVEAKNLARFDLWRLQPNIPPKEPNNLPPYETYREELETAFRERSAELDAMPATMELEIRLEPAR